MKIIKPPTSLVTNYTRQKAIFLAGSIEMGKAEDWQTKIIKLFKGKDYIFFNPRRDEWDASWGQEYENPQFYQQVNWELNALDKSDIIIMYFSPDTKSPISLLELGLYANTNKVLVICPKEFWRSGNVEIVCEKYGIPLFRTIDELMKLFQHG